MGGTSSSDSSHLRVTLPTCPPRLSGGAARASAAKRFHAAPMVPVTDGLCVHRCQGICPCQPMAPPRCHRTHHFAPRLAAHTTCPASQGRAALPCPNRDPAAVPCVLPSAVPHLNQRLVYIFFGWILPAGACHRCQSSSINDPKQCIIGSHAHTSTYTRISPVIGPRLHATRAPHETHRTGARGLRARHGQCRHCCRWGWMPTRRRPRPRQRRRPCWRGRT